MNLAELVKTNRERLGMSGAELAKKIGVSGAHLCDVERGRKSLAPERFARLVDALPGLAFEDVCAAAVHTAIDAGAALLVKPSSLTPAARAQLVDVLRGLTAAA